MTPLSLSRRTCNDHKIMGGSALTILALAMCVSVVPALSNQFEIQATPVPTKAEHNACHGTPYPEECVSSLTSHRTCTNSNNNQEASFLIAALTSSIAAVQDFKSLCNSSFGDTRTCVHSVLGMCVQSLESAEKCLDSISHLKLLTESNSVGRMGEVLTWLSACMTYHTTCMDETSHCSNLEGLNISLAHGNKSMVRATNCVLSINIVTKILVSDAW